MNLFDTLAEMYRWFESQIRYRENRPGDAGYTTALRVQSKKCFDALEAEEDRMEREVDESGDLKSDEPKFSATNVPKPDDWPPTDAPILGDRVYVWLQLTGMPGERELVAMSAEVIMERPDPMKPGLGIKPPNQSVSGLPGYVQVFAEGYSPEPKLGYWNWPPRPLR